MGSSWGHFAKGAELIPGRCVPGLEVSRHGALPRSWPGLGVADQCDLPAGDALFHRGAGEGVGHAGAIGGDVLIALMTDAAHLGRAETGVLDNHPGTRSKPFEEPGEGPFLLFGGEGVAAPAAPRGFGGLQLQGELPGELLGDGAEFGVATAEPMCVDTWLNRFPR